MSTKDKAFFYVGASQQHVAGIRAVRSAGVYTVVTDRSANAPGSAHADRFAAIDASDVDALLGLADDVARDFTIIGGYGVADYTSPAISAIYEKICQIDGPTSRIHSGLIAPLRRSANKVEASNYWRASGLSVPETIWSGEGATALDDLADILGHCNGQSIVKPAKGYNSRGLSYVEGNSKEALGRAIKKAALHGGLIIIEDLIPGRLVNVDGLMIDGRMHPIGIIERDCYGDDGFQPLTGILPARMPLEDQDALFEVAFRAALSLGFRDGPFTVDVILSNEGPVLLELTPNFHSILITLASENGWALRAWLAYLAADPSWENYLEPPSSRAAGYLQLYAPKAGSVHRIRGVDEISAMPGFQTFYLLKDIGSSVRNEGGFFDVCGAVWLNAATRAELDAAVRHVSDNLVFETSKHPSPASQQ